MAKVRRVFSEIKSLRPLSILQQSGKNEESFPNAPVWKNFRARATRGGIRNPRITGTAWEIIHSPASIHLLTNRILLYGLWIALWNVLTPKKRVKTRRVSRF